MKKVYFCIYLPYEEDETCPLGTKFFLEQFDKIKTIVQGFVSVKLCPEDLQFIISLTFLENHQLINEHAHLELEAEYESFVDQRMQIFDTIVEAYIKQQGWSESRFQLRMSGENGSYLEQDARKFFMRISKNGYHYGGNVIDYLKIKTIIENPRADILVPAFVKLVDTLFCKFRQLKIA